MISIIIPVRNEEDNIENVIASISEKVHVPYEMIILNDNSTDGTEKRAEALVKKYRAVRLINRRKNPGFGNTLMEGFKNARGSAVVPVMADLCDDPETINKMFKKMKDYDIVVGSRYMEGGRSIGSPFLKSWISRNYGRLLHHVAGLPTTDATNAFKMYKKNVISAVEIKKMDFSISVELVLKAHFAGFRITDVPTTWRGRKKGSSKFKLLQMGKSYGSLFLCSLFRRKKY